jgi:hypothetical protein
MGKERNACGILMEIQKEGDNIKIDLREMR